MSEILVTRVRQVALVIWVMKVIATCEMIVLETMVSNVGIFGDAGNS